MNKSIFAISLLGLTHNVWASGGSAIGFSLYMFIFFGIAALILTKIVKHYSKNIKNERLKKIVGLIPFCLLMSPTLYIEDGGGMLLPSAVVFQLVFENSNSASMYSLLVSVSITFIFLYFLKVSNLENMKEFD